MSELVIRFLVGGLIVSLFAMLSDALRPKSFAGLFGAAPSIALATLGLTVLKNGRAYAAAESRSMMLGALLFLTYAATVSWALRRYRVSALGASMVLLPLWFLVSFCLWRLGFFLCGLKRTPYLRHILPSGGRIDRVEIRTPQSSLMIECLGLCLQS